MWDSRDGLGVMSVCSSFRGSAFDSQNPLLPVTLALGRTPPLASESICTRVRIARTDGHTCM